MNDIENEADVRTLVDEFYRAVRQDELLNPIFSEVVQVDWEIHLPKMYAFWNGLLLGIPGDTGQPFAPHTRLPVSQKHFFALARSFSRDGRSVVRRSTSTAGEEYRSEHCAYLRDAPV